MPVYISGHFALRIYNCATNCLGSIDTYLNIIEQNWNYRRIVIIYKNFIKEGCPGAKEPKAIRVAILPQVSFINYGWQVANYVAFFF